MSDSHIRAMLLLSTHVHPPRGGPSVWRPQQHLSMKKQREGLIFGFKPLMTVAKTIYLLSRDMYVGIVSCRRRRREKENIRVVRRRPFTAVTSAS